MWPQNKVRVRNTRGTRQYEKTGGSANAAQQINVSTATLSTAGSIGEVRYVTLVVCFVRSQQQCRDLLPA